MKALVVDGEPLVRSELVYTLGRVAEDCVVHEAESALEALAKLQDATYDVVFLDIRMPGLSGFDAVSVIERLPKRPHVVFITAYADHALKAFEVAAIDYLLKPVTEARLAETLKRVSARAPAKPASEPSVFGRLPVESNGRVFLVHVEDIRYIEAQGHVVTVALFEQTLRFRGSLAECLRRIERYGFLRVHRAYIVNPQRVVEFNPLLGGTYVLRVDDRARSEVPVSRNFVPAVRAAFEL